MFFKALASMYACWGTEDRTAFYLQSLTQNSLTEGPQLCDVGGGSGVRSLFHWQARRLRLTEVIWLIPVHTTNWEQRRGFWLSHLLLSSHKDKWLYRNCPIRCQDVHPLAQQQSPWILSGPPVPGSGLGRGWCPLHVLLEGTNWPTQQTVPHGFTENLQCQQRSRQHSTGLNTWCAGGMYTRKTLQKSILQGLGPQPFSWGLGRAFEGFLEMQSTDQS